MEQTLDIAWKTIIKVLITGFSLYLLFLSRDIIIWFFFALIISLLIEPAIDSLRWLRLPKILAVIVVYLSIFGLLGLMIYLIAPIFIFELGQLSSNIPQYFEKFNPILKDVGLGMAQNFEDFTLTLVSKLQESSDSIIKAIFVFFGGIASTAIIFTFAFFISLEDKGPERVLALLVPKKYEEYTIRLFERAQYRVSRWFGARILACVFVGVTSFIAFYLLDVKYAFIFALLTGVLNFVPYVGPTITLVLTVLFVGVSNSWMVAVYIFIALLLIQEIENKFLTPILMKKFMDMPPVLVLVALLVGHTIFGFLGMIFIVPIFGIIFEFTREFLQKKREEESF